MSNIFLPRKTNTLFVSAPKGAQIYYNTNKLCKQLFKEIKEKNHISINTHKIDIY